MNILILTCEQCGADIGGNTGCLYLREHEIAGRRRASLPGDSPEPVLLHWRSAHDRCRSDMDVDCYEIDAPRVGSAGALERVSLHMRAKRWLLLTDWDLVMREAAGEVPSVRFRLVGLEAA